MRELLNACKRDKASNVSSLLKASPKEFDLTSNDHHSNLSNFPICNSALILTIIWLRDQKN